MSRAVELLQKLEEIDFSDIVLKQGIPIKVGGLSQKESVRLVI